MKHNRNILIAYMSMWHTEHLHLGPSTNFTTVLNYVKVKADLQDRGEVFHIF